MIRDYLKVKLKEIIGWRVITFVQQSSTLNLHMACLLEHKWRLASTRDAFCNFFDQVWLQIVSPFPPIRALWAARPSDDLWWTVALDLDPCPCSRQDNHFLSFKSNAGSKTIKSHCNRNNQLHFFSKLTIFLMQSHWTPLEVGIMGCELCQAVGCSWVLCQDKGN